MVWHTELLMAISLAIQGKSVGLTSWKVPEAGSVGRLSGCNEPEIIGPAHWKESKTTKESDGANPIFRACNPFSMHYHDIA